LPRLHPNVVDMCAWQRVKGPQPDDGAPPSRPGDLGRAKRWPLRPGRFHCV